jgi:hypothetical protein
MGINGADTLLLNHSGFLFPLSLSFFRKNHPVVVRHIKTDINHNEFYQSLHNMLHVSAILIVLRHLNKKF